MKISVVGMLIAVLSTLAVSTSPSIAERIIEPSDVWLGKCKVGFDVDHLITYQAFGNEWTRPPTQLQRNLADALGLERSNSNSLVVLVQEYGLARGVALSTGHNYCFDDIGIEDAIVLSIEDVDGFGFSAISARSTARKKFANALCGKEKVLDLTSKRISADSPNSTPRFLDLRDTIELSWSACLDSAAWIEENTAIYIYPVELSESQYEGGTSTSSELVPAPLVPQYVVLANRFMIDLTE